MGWHHDERHDGLFTWKHRDNPFGRSIGWVAHDRGRLVALRLLMRWEFEAGGAVVRAVRAVDTVTAPDHRGQGLFSSLTRQALDDARAADVAFVFNTPNGQSAPGYRKLGWESVGRLGAAVRPRSVAALGALARRDPADLWSAPDGGGEPAAGVLADAPAVDGLLARRRRPTGLRTRLSAEVLAWRYGWAPLDYRAIVAPGGLRDGLAVYRVRRRGERREAALCELIVPAGRHGTARRLVREVARASAADHVLGLGPGLGSGMIPVPAGGPLLTWRAVTSSRRPKRANWALGLGDIELF